MRIETPYPWRRVSFIVWFHYSIWWQNLNFFHPFSYSLISHSCFWLAHVNEIINYVRILSHISGPSYSIDVACASSLMAVDQALQSIRSGQCEAAIVGGSNLGLDPKVSVQLQKLGLLSPDGIHRSFDEAGGFAITERIDAHRRYTLPCLNHFYPRCIIIQE